MNELRTARYLVQMSGVPGSGKSTLARCIAQSVNAILVDHDDTKSAIMSTGVEPDLAGQASYEVIKALVPGFLEAGHNVIIDSPCLYSELLNFGEQAAKSAGAKYRYIECKLDDLQELSRRITGRKAKPSQNQFGPLDARPIQHRGREPMNAKDLFLDWARNMKRPQAYLLVDSSRDLDVCVQQALRYIHDNNSPESL